MDVICDAAGLERVVGRRSLPALLKSIDRLDGHCGTLLKRSPAAVLGYLDGEGRPRAALIGGRPGFAVPETPTRLGLSMPSDIAPGTGAALLVLLPGWRATLRVNGTAELDGLDVDEAFLHCGKAVIRSRLWEAAGSPGTATDDTDGIDSADSTEDGVRLGSAATEFLVRAPFAVIASHDGDGRADASPKGDPPGVLRVLGPTTVAIADRPGNRRTDTFHNLLDDSGIAMVAVAPGDDRTLELTGTATISTDPALRTSLSERNRTPKAALLVELTRVRLARSAALRESGLWEADNHIDPAELPSPATVWTDHVKLNEHAGTTAKLLRKVASEPVLRAGLAADYRQNLY